MVGRVTVKLSHEDVVHFLKEKGLTLLTKKYKGSVQTLDYKCDTCDEHDTCTMGNRKTRKIWCKVCDEGAHTALTLKIVAARFARRGFKLLETEFTDVITPMKYECGCGTIDYMPYQRMMKSPAGCKECAEKRRKAECLEKYGTTHPQKSKVIREKTKATCLEKYGVENTFQHPEFKQKIKDTFMEQHGVTSPMHVPEFIEKQKQTMITNYGVGNAMQNPEVRARASQTCMDRYGVDNPQKVPEFYDKAQNAFKKKDFTFPSGRIIRVQGYEPQALDILVQTYDENQIIADSRENIPVITYDFEGKSCKFYPDVFIPHKNKIIEVKSTYTYLSYEEKNQAKIAATTAQGYNLEYWIFAKKGRSAELVRIISTSGD